MGDRIRLNLGCGSKPQEGYINIDLSGGPGVIKSDIRKLHYQNDSVDEIQAIHIIEHMAPLEGVETLREWHRVLKPDGLLIIECPNMMKCFGLILAGDERTSFVGMLGLFGDSSKTADNPLMCHKWGYTPASLTVILKSVGFRKIANTVPQTHVLARDMRIEAVK